MNEIVFLEPNKIDAIPFTTSKVISECTEVGHRYVKEQIFKRQKELETFGLLVAHATESSGGRPEEIIALNEEQATLLITFLKNTPAVVAFKTELVRQFFLMRTELMKRRTYREELKPIRRELTDVIQIMDADNVWAYKQYTDLAYKSVTGKIARKLREERGADKTAKAIDYMTSDEIQGVARKQSQIAVLRDMGMEYDQIKALMFHTVPVTATVTARQG
jgi:phage regulator Rha-like protein